MIFFLQSKEDKAGSEALQSGASAVRDDKYWQVLSQRFKDGGADGKSKDENITNKKWVRKFLPVASEVVIQDPFELNHNVSKGIGDIGLENWKNHCCGKCR